jgi:hypothetical protein
MPDERMRAVAQHVAVVRLDQGQETTRFVDGVGAKTCREIIEDWFALD